MKKIIILTLFLCGFYAAFSQDCYDKVEKQAVVIDSLQKVIKSERDNSQNQISNSKKITKDLGDTIKSLRSDLSKLEKFKAEKKMVDTQFKVKNDSIALLKTQLSERDKQIATAQTIGEQKALEAKEKGKAEAVASIVNSYKNRAFDDLIKSSTKLSLQRDMQLIGNNTEVKQILNDLSLYFNAEELLAKKFDAAAVKDIQTQLNQIEQNSTLLDKLKDKIEYYQDFNNALKETINKLINLDKQKEASGDSEIQKLKFQEILSELSNYMYNYYDYSNYPYLSDIVLEIIKRKQPDADADIKDLLSRL